ASCRFEMIDSWRGGGYYLLRLPVLVCAPDYCSRRTHQNFQIQERGPVGSVVQIEADHFVERNTVAALHLPRTCNPGLHLHQPAPVPGLVIHQLIWDWGPRPY